MINSVIKRDGRIEDFDSAKILTSIAKANNCSYDEKMTSADIQNVTQKICQLINDQHISKVVDIEDIVEKILLQHGYVATAKAYLLSRY